MLGLTSTVDFFLIIPLFTLCVSFNFSFSFFLVKSKFGFGVRMIPFIDSIFLKVFIICLLLNWNFWLFLLLSTKKPIKFFATDFLFFFAFSLRNDFNIVLCSFDINFFFDFIWVIFFLEIKFWKELRFILILSLLKIFWTGTSFIFSFLIISEFNVFTISIPFIVSFCFIKIILFFL